MYIEVATKIYCIVRTVQLSPSSLLTAFISIFQFELHHHPPPPNPVVCHVARSLSWHIIMFNFKTMFFAAKSADVCLQLEHRQATLTCHGSPSIRRSADDVSGRETRTASKSKTSFAFPRYCMSMQVEGREKGSNARNQPAHDYFFSLATYAISELLSSLILHKTESRLSNLSSSASARSCGFQIARLIKKDTITP